MIGPVVITGEKGFIGSHLLESLVKNGFNAIGFAQLIDGKNNDYLSIEEVKNCDIPEHSTLVHLAENNDVALYEKSGDEIVTQSHALLDALLKKKWEHVIYSSSSLVYGDSSELPHDPNEAVQPFNKYTTSKIQNENMVLSTNGTVLRLANVYGPGMATNNVISDILKQVSGETDIVVRDSSPVRDFIWIDDVVDAFLQAIKLRKTGIFNVGNSQAISIAELAEIIKQTFNISSRTVKSLKSSSNKSVIKLNTKKTEVELKWEAKTDLLKGLKILRDFV